MSRTILKKLILLLLASVCLAQPLPSNFAAAGAALNQSSRPPLAGWFSYAVLMSEKGQLYSYTTHDIFLAQTHPYVVQSSVRTGLATVMRRVGPILILGLGDAGIAAGGTSVGGAFSGGGVGIITLGKTNWAIVLGGRVIKTSGGGSQTVYELGMGRKF